MLFGMMAATGGSLFLLINRFSKKEKQQRKIDGKIKRYMLKDLGEDLLFEHD